MTPREMAYELAELTDLELCIECEAPVRYCYCAEAQRLDSDLYWEWLAAAYDPDDSDDDYEPTHPAPEPGEPC